MGLVIAVKGEQKVEWNNQPGFGEPVKNRRTNNLVILLI